MSGQKFAGFTKGIHRVQLLEGHGKDLLITAEELVDIDLTIIDGECCGQIVDRAGSEFIGQFAGLLLLK